VLLEVSCDLLLLQDGELMVFADIGNFNAVGLHLAFVTCRLPQSRETVQNEFLESGVSELFEVVLKVGPG
jgi:hypothetical protein